MHKAKFDSLQLLNVTKWSNFVLWSHRELNFCQTHEQVMECCNKHIARQVKSVKKTFFVDAFRELSSSCSSSSSSSSFSCSVWQ